MRETKTPVQELWLKMGGGAYGRDFTVLVAFSSSLCLDSL